jgi:putative DNA primase/helicase
LEELGLTAKWSSHRAEEVTQYIQTRSRQLLECPPLNRVNLKNGILDLDTGKLLEHSPDFVSPIQLPVVYDPDATCPAWDKFAEDTFPEDAQELAFEIPALLMVPDLSLQKSLLAIGAGGNGKSTYLAALTAFLGRSNVCSVSLHKLESDRFATARLLGKLANICADLPSSHLAGTSVFKAITGGDTLCAEYKFKPSFDFVPFCRLVFSANHPPRSSDSSEAFFRRWLTVPFARVFEGGEAIPRPELDARLGAPEELSGVLNKAIKALRQIRKRGGLLESATMKAAHAEFRQATDPLSVWLDRRTVQDGGLFVMKKALLSAYNQDAQKDGRPSMTPNAMSRALHELRPNTKDGQRTVNAKIEWCWLGLGLSSGDEEQVTVP